MKRKLFYTTAVLVVLGTVLTFALLRDNSREVVRAEATATDGSATREQEIISAPGLVEPVSEEIEVGAEMPGKIKDVMAEEGQSVTRNQILAVLENADYAAQVAAAASNIASSEAQALAAEARVQQARAELRRVVNGARVEERREARAAFEQADVIVGNAQTELARRRALFAEGDVAREELERAERDMKVAEARRRELRERFGFVNAAAREEDVARAEATVRLSEAQVNEARARILEARAQRAEAQARLDKSYIRSPIAGVVLRKRLRVGESVSPESPNSSIFTIADTSMLRVRVDVDERDVGGISVGQKAYVTAEAYGERKFTGRVVQIGQVLGRKNVRTEEPTERVDKKILETLVELDAGQWLPPGLRVDAFIVNGGGETANAARGEQNARR
jgi:HlyD family secretion protein